MKENDTSTSGVPMGSVRANDSHSQLYDWRTDDTPSYGVLETVAELTGTDPLSLQPLVETVDPDALDALLAPSIGNAGPSPDLRVSFRYAEVDVSVRADGHVTAVPADERDR